MKAHKSVNGFNCIPDEFPHKSGSHSNCCGADMYHDSDLCPDCKEHCASMTYCKTCEGTGEINFSNGLKLYCTICNGEGSLENEG